MRMVFADTSYYLGVLVPSDQHSVLAMEFTEGFSGKMVTTTAVLTEVGNAVASSRYRRDFQDFVEILRQSPDVEMVIVDESLWSQELELYARREDKEWSLTDCISFVVMNDRGLTDAATTDHHFEQAGFTALLAK